MSSARSAPPAAAGLRRGRANRSSRRPARTRRARPCRSRGRAPRRSRRATPTRPRSSRGTCVLPASRRRRARTSAHRRAGARAARGALRLRAVAADRARPAAGRGRPRPRRARGRGRGRPPALPRPDACGRRDSRGDCYRAAVRFEGIHHVTCITGDAPGNVDFYVRVLGLRVVATTDEPLIADHPEIPRELALQGFDGVRAYADPGPSRAFLEQVLSFDPHGDSVWEVRGGKRGSWYAYDEPPLELGVPGAGTVHHVAWASPPEAHEAWQKRVAESGAHPTPVIDRFYFKSIYFREPSGVLFEIATIGPGFTVDEPLEHLGEKLSLPPDYEHLRATVEPVLTPLPNLRELVQR